MAEADRIVAIVDDDEFVRPALRRSISSSAYKVVAYASGEEFLNSIGADIPICVLLDLHMPGLNGLDVLMQLQAKRLNFPVIVITGNEQPGMGEKCLAAGAAAFLPKPLERQVVISAIEKATARSNQG